MKKLISFLTVFLLLNSSAALAKPLSTGEMGLWLDNKLECENAAIKLNVFFKEVRGYYVSASCDGNKGNVLVTEILFFNGSKRTRKVDISIGWDMSYLLGGKYVPNQNFSLSQCKVLVKTLDQISKEHPFFQANLKCHSINDPVQLPNIISRSKIQARGKIRILK